MLGSIPALIPHGRNWIAKKCATSQPKRRKLKFEDPAIPYAAEKSGIYETVKWNLSHGAMVAWGVRGPGFDPITTSKCFFPVRVVERKI